MNKSKINSKSIEESLKNAGCKISGIEKRIDYKNISSLGWIEKNKVKIVYPVDNLDEEETQNTLRYISRLKHILTVKGIEFDEDEKSKKECISKINEKIKDYNFLKKYIREIVFP